MDLRNGVPGSSKDTRVTSTLDGKEVTGIEAERVLDVSEVADQETTIPAIKTEPNLQTASALLSYKRKKHVCSEPCVMASKPTSINDLPDEIVLEILSYVGPEELCLNIAKVCEKWNVLAKDVPLWKTLSYHCDSSSDISRIAEVLTNAPALHSLTIHERKDVTVILEFLFHKHVDLRELILWRCWLGEDSNGLLANIVDLIPHLEDLSLLICSPLTSASYYLIPHLKKLSALDISYCHGLSGKTVRHIVDSCQHLKVLILHNAQEFFDDDAIHVIKKLGKQLTTLVLDGDNLTDTAYLYLNNCTRLKELGVSLCGKMTDRGLLEGIGSLQELEYLNLSGGYNLTAQALSTFLHGPSMTYIAMLDLSLCYELDDDGLKGIAERCVHLKELAVCECSIVTDAGISMVISHCSELRKLDLMDLLSITGEGWLALVPAHVPHLKKLCLAGCTNVREKCVEELVAAVPELEVDK